MTSCPRRRSRPGTVSLTTTSTATSPLDAATSSEINSWGASPAMGDPQEMRVIATAPTISSLYKGRDTAAYDESEIP